MALRRGDLPWSVSLWTRRKGSVAAVEAAVPGSRVTCDLGSAIDGADVVVLCTPPQAIEESAELLARIVPPEVFITDAASVKARICSALGPLLGGRFVGAHPMAGSEQSGIASARADLFDGAPCILTATENSSPAALDAVRTLWSAAGCRIHEMSPSAHDAAVARVSHLPHAAAAALVLAALEPDPSAAALAGTGYRDSTRVACGPEDLWADIFLANREAVASGISDLRARLGDLGAAIAEGDRSAIASFLRHARILRGGEEL
jgi:prephenate dehydrogenase